MTFYDHPNREAVGLAPIWAAGEEPAAAAGDHAERSAPDDDDTSSGPAEKPRRGRRGST